MESSTYKHNENDSRQRASHTVLIEENEDDKLRSYLFESFVPGRPSQMTSFPDLYGPSMVVLTMVALLLFNMKSSGFVVPNGTLMGTALFTCFGSWLSLSSVLYLVCSLFGADISLLQLISSFTVLHRPE
uniref:Protein YIPF3 n=1 Tax=Heterorhabditis bacteriophora TaxID=37862 RepID=A0A1I7XI45_HETBA